MSADDELASVPLEVLAAGADEIASECASDLSTLLGREIAVQAQGTAFVAAGEVVENDLPIVHQLCRTAEEPVAFVHLIAPRPTAATLGGLQLGNDPEAIAATLDSELDAERRGAFQSVMKIVADVVSRQLGEHLPSEVEPQDAREIPEPASDPTWLDGEHFLRLRLALSTEALPDGRIALLLPSDDEGEAAAGASVCFLEASADERARLEQMAAALACPVRAFGVEDVEGDGGEGLGDAAVIVVPWDVAGRSGIELVERLSRGERTSQVPIVMASDSPTRDRVAAALRAGACGFVFQPYAAEELREALARVRCDEPRGEEEGA